MAGTLPPKQRRLRQNRPNAILIRFICSGAPFPGGVGDVCTIAALGSLLGNMSFALIDRIVDLEAGSSIRAVKSPSLSEEYLQDHFPQFPVMPGVLMLEAMYQAAAWLVRATDDFSHSVVILKEARNVKYSGFVRPGEMLSVTAEIQEREGGQTTIKAIGQIGDTKVVSAKLILQQRNLADDNPVHATIDRILVERQKRDLSMLYSEMPDVSA